MQDQPAHDGYPPAGRGGPSPPIAEDQLHQYLDDAELLLRYAIESGLVVEQAVTRHVLEARAAPPGNRPPEVAANLLDAAATRARCLRVCSAAP
jgi:hypothetical protein